MAAARFDSHSQGEVGVLVFLGDGLQAVGCAWCDVDGKVVAILVFAWVLDGLCVSWDRGG